MEKVRLIDANALKKQFIKTANSMARNGFQTYASAMEEAAKMAERQPTIEVESVRHGYWIGLEGDGYADGFPVYDVWECSSCKDEWNGEETPCWCPNCGAKMDAKEKRQNDQG